MATVNKNEKDEEAPSSLPSTSKSNHFNGSWNYYPQGNASNPFFNTSPALAFMKIKKDTSEVFETNDLKGKLTATTLKALLGKREARTLFAKSYSTCKKSKPCVPEKLQSPEKAPIETTECANLVTKLKSGRARGRAPVKCLQIASPGSNSEISENSGQAFPERSRSPRQENKSVFDSREDNVQESEETDPAFDKSKKLLNMVQISGEKQCVIPNALVISVPELVKKFVALKLSDDQDDGKPSTSKQVLENQQQSVQESKWDQVKTCESPVGNVKAIEEHPEAKNFESQVPVAVEVEEKFLKGKYEKPVAVKTEKEYPLQQKSWTLEEMINHLIIHGDKTTKTHKAQMGLFAKQFCDACIYGPMESVVEMLHGEHVTVNMALKHSWSGLQHACYHGQLRVVEVLLNVGADPNFCRADDGITVLMSATCSPLNEQEGVYECLKLVLKAGANVNAKQSNGYSPLIYAVRRGHSQMCKYLLENGADVNEQDLELRTPINWAAHRNRIDMVQLLLDYGANPSIKNNRNQTSFKTAIHEGHSQIASMLAYSQSCSWRVGIPEKHLDTSMAKKDRLIHYVKNRMEESNSSTKLSKKEEKPPAVELRVEEHDSSTKSSKKEANNSSTKSSKKEANNSSTKPSKKEANNSSTKSSKKDATVPTGEGAEPKLQPKIPNSLTAITTTGAVTTTAGIRFTVKKPRALKKFRKWSTSRKLAVISSLVILGILLRALTNRK